MFKTALLQLRTKGIKNIENEVTIDFYRNKSLLNFDMTNDRVRVLYGPNGSGKSSVVASVWLIKQLFNSDSFLARCGSGFLSQLLNKKKKDFSISLLVAFWDEHDKRPSSFRYSMAMAFEDGEFQIEEESITFVSSARLDENKAKTILLARQGKLEVLDTSLGNDFYRDFEGEVRNLCRKSSVLNLFTRLLNKKGYKDAFLFDVPNHKGNRAIYAALMYFLTLSVYLDSSDLHENEMEPPSDLFEYLSSVSKEELIAPLLDPAQRGNRYSIRINKSDYGRYEKYVKRLELFIKQFKPDLKGIEIDKRLDGSQYRCQLVFVYKAGRVDFEFESTGIKKLTNIFSTLESAVGGGTAFIDELDANVSGVYLRKLIEFVEQYAKGQLFFTAHSLDPMYALYTNSKAIYFIGNENLISVWKKNGNTRPYTLYPDGMVPGIYFNIDAFDFLPCFESEER